MVVYALCNIYNLNLAPTAFWGVQALDTGRPKQQQLIQKLLYAVFADFYCQLHCICRCDIVAVELQ